MDAGLSQEEYVRQVLEAYRKTPGTMGTVRRADRTVAAQLFQRGLPVQVIENALVLAATRRLIRPPDAQPLGAIRSLAYFLPVIEEVLKLRVRSTLTICDASSEVAERHGNHASASSTPRAPSARMMKTNPHACGVDDVARSRTPFHINTPSAWMMPQSRACSKLRSWRRSV